MYILALFSIFLLSVVRGNVFSSDDVASLQRLVAANVVDDTFADVRLARFAASALTDVGLELPQKKAVCKLAGDVIGASDCKLSSALHAALIGSLLKCGSAPSKEVLGKLENALNSSKLSDLYAGIVAYHALKRSGQVSSLPSFSAAVKSIVALADESGSFKSSSSSSTKLAFNAGLAFEALALAGSKKSVASATKHVAALLAAGKRDESGALALLDVSARSALANLRASAAVLVGLNALTKAGYKVEGVADADISGLALYLLQEKRVTSLAAAASLTRGLAATGVGAAKVPLIATLVNNALTAKKDGNQLNLKVTDVFGKHVTKTTVTVAEVRAKDAKKALLEDVPATAASKDTKNVDYTASLTSKALACGRYVATISAVPKNTDAVAGIDGARLTFKVLCKVAPSDFSMTIHAASSSAGKGDQTDSVDVAFGDLHPDAIALATRQTLKLSFRVKNTISKAELKVQQAFIRLSHAKSSRSHTFVASRDDDGLYSASLHLAGQTVSALGRQSGAWTAELLLGDECVETAVRWPFAELAIKFKGAPKKLVGGGLARSLPVIDHKFREDASRPPAVVSYLFTGLALLPLLGLVVALGRVGVNMGGFGSLGAGTKLFAMLFHVAVGATLGLLVLYWWRLNMLQTLKLLALLVILLVALGRPVLAKLQQNAK